VTCLDYKHASVLLMFTFVLNVWTLFSRMEHSSVQVDTALRLTSVVMVTGTAGI